jgi:hypothetical protein
MVVERNLPLFYEPLSANFVPLTASVFEDENSQRLIGDNLRHILQSSFNTFLVSPPAHVRHSLHHLHIDISTISPILICSLIKSINEQQQPPLSIPAAAELVRYITYDINNLSTARQFELLESLSGIECVPLKGEKLVALIYIPPNSESLSNVYVGKNIFYFFVNLSLYFSHSLSFSLSLSLSLSPSL